ncbi:polyprenyl synthetase family protein [Flavobacteriales bacterium]|nr:polyprenyl synthetase family protein [Flavobacteriales bacterium]MDA7578692.1 polyprenyl synthetase family protein [Flavobacteriales bacterium]MDA7596394.1 polyprenyl synthetase family protein [Flavobacteriales bacterium]
MKDLSQIAEIIEAEINNISYLKDPENLYSPIEYTMELGGKRIRPILLLISYQLFNDNFERAFSPAKAIELFHNFTLLHDDIMDKAPLRRGKITVHKKWNNNIAILSGDVMMIHAYQLLAQVESKYLKSILNIFNKAAIEVCEGQQWDMDFESKDDVPLIDYMQMIEFKTAVLLAASLKIGAVLADAKKKDQNHLYEFGLNMGIAFQLKDDLLDVFGTSKLFGKKIGGDIIANKKTFLYLKALQISDFSTKLKLKKLYTSENENDTKVEKVKKIFVDLNIKKHTLDLMKSYYIKAMKHLDAIDSDKKSPLIDFADKLMHRDR